MRYEFNIELKQVLHKTQYNPETANFRVPPIKRTLVLAYQIADYMKNHNISTMKAFCKHGNITSGRLTQIMKVLLLSLNIQTEILTTDNPKFYKISEVTLRPLLQEVLWPKQEELWRSFSVLTES